MAVVAIVAMVPITPGAIGVTEVAYIGVLSAVTGPAAADQITAAIMLFRIAQWLAPIPIGWTLLLILRRGHWGDILSPSDSPSPAADEAAATS
jgi:putative heme transporter